MFHALALLLRALALTIACLGSARAAETAASAETPVPGWQWNLDNAQVPLIAPQGQLGGQAVVFDSARIEGDSLILTQGKAEVRFTVPAPANPVMGESLATIARNGGPKFRTQTWLHTQAGSGGGQLSISAIDPAGKALKSDSWSARLGIREIKDGKYPVEIYVCWKDAPKSHVVGRINATIPAEMVAAAEAARDARDPLKKARRKP